MRRPQFTLRALLVLMLAAAVIAWGVSLVGAAAFVLPLLACLPLAGGSFRKPLEGILLNVFIAIVASWVGMAVFVVMGD